MYSFQLLTLFLSCAQAYHATMTSPPSTTPHDPMHAINPTVTGQIGINPVDIPPVTSL